MSTTLTPATAVAAPTRSRRPDRPHRLDRPDRSAGPALSAAALAAVTRHHARVLRAGGYGEIRYGDPARPGDPEARWHVRVHADDVVDVWVISWLPSQGTQLHDHGGSAGAFTVVHGALTEAVWTPAGRLADRGHRAGRTVTFGPEHVHDVRNLDAAPAVSVHAYSRPLRAMGYYDVVGGVLRRTAVLDTTDPEPAS